LYLRLDPNDYRVSVGSGLIEAKMVIVAAGAMGTPVILQRSAPFLGGMPPAVGRYFSANGDRVTVAALDEGKVHDLLGLERAPGVAYDAFPIGKPISSMTFDYLDPSAPSFRASACSRSTFRRSRTSSLAWRSRRSGSGSTSVTSPRAGARGSRSSR
jgi:hypothetical protein